MTTELRKTGISVVGDIPWGTHFCSFYESKQDLLDTLVPYFKAGLGDREYCVWVIADPLTREEAWNALRLAVPDLDRHESNQSIEMFRAEEWYLQGGPLDLNRITNAWTEKLDQALARGYQGLRVSGDACWLQERDWQRFCAYENHLNKSILNQAMTVLCTYPLAQSGAAEFLNVARAHQFAMARRQGNWEVVETLELKQARAEIEKLNEELEQRVVERTRELREANEELGKEIIERRQVERELRESQQQHESLVQSIGGIVWEVNVQTFRFTFVSKQAERILGYPLAQWLEPNFWADHLHPDDRDWAVGFCLDATQRRADHQLEYRMIDAEGRAVWLRDLVTVHVMEDQSVRLRGVMVDIGERKRAEEKLRQRESQLAEAQRLAHVGSWDWDLRRSTVTWSDELYRIFGLQPQEIDVAREAMLFIHPEDRDVVLSTVQSAVKNKEPYSFYYRIFRRDGDKRIVHSRGHVVSDEDGAPIRVFGATQDVTELKHAEEKLKATSEQLRALSARLQSVREEEGARIAREIHDELGSALTTLKWDLETIDREYVEARDNADLGRIREKITAMMQLIDATTHTMKRISSELRPSILDDIGLVEAIEWQTEQFQTRTGIICSCDCGLEGITFTQEQSTAIFRVFQEALTNILRHAQATQVDVAVKRGAGEVVLTIKDNGRGITEEEKSRPQSLGLLGMRERVFLIGGQIDITGVEGEGTVVTLQVPLSN